MGNIRGIIRNSAKYGLIIIVVALFAFPIYWMLMTSVKPANLVMVYPPVFLPPEATFTPYLGGSVSAFDALDGSPPTKGSFSFFHPLKKAE